MESLFFPVCVRCFTYNQANYIEKTLDGFCSQNTNFPYVCTIVDDCSNDGEQNVLTGYVHAHFDLDDHNYFRTEDNDDYSLIFARHRINHFCFFAVILLKYNHYSNPAIGSDRKFQYISEWHNPAKYVAICEGDDYWTDSDKLQKQYDVLESHPSVTCVHTGFYTIDKDGKEITRPTYEGYMKRSHNGNVITALLNGNYVMTLTTMYRSEVFKSLIYRSCPSKYDYAMTFSAAMMGDFIYLPEKTACYRKTPGGAMDSMHSNPNHPLVKKRKEVYSYFSRLIIERESDSLKERLIQRCHILIHLMKVNDYETVNYIATKDKWSKVLYPLAIVYKYFISNR
jgi:glycosyltransferase involved in cell wall biosynthesis